jgi:hypothetical protein
MGFRVKPMTMPLDPESSGILKCLPLHLRYGREMGFQLYS